MLVLVMDRRALYGYIDLHITAFCAGEVEYGSIIIKSISSNVPSPALLQRKIVLRKTPI